MGKEKYLVTRKKFPLGIIIFGSLLMITSILQMRKFVSFDDYHRIFQQLPPVLVAIRYCISITLRILGFLSGLGILLRRNWARILALSLAIFTILTLYWKHPYFVVSNYYKIIFYFANSPLDGAQVVLPQNLKLLTFITLGVFYLIDIVFFGSLTYYLTRPKVKAYFIHSR